MSFNYLLEFRYVNLIVFIFFVRRLLFIYLFYLELFPRDTTHIDTHLTVQSYVNNVEFYTKTHPSCNYNEYANIFDN